MIETIIFEYLGANLDEPVYMERPEEAPESFVLIEKTGSQQSNHITTSTFAFQSYAPSLYKAVVLNEKVKSIMLEAITLAEISRSTLNGDYNFTDTSTKEYRYQSVFDITHY